MGTEDTGASFSCPKCKLEHAWSAEFVGRAARCVCGRVLKVPKRPEKGEMPAQATDRVEIALTAAPAPVVAATKDDGGVPSFLRMPTEPAPDPDALDAETEAELAAVAKYGEADRSKPDPRRDLYVPIALLAAGVLITFIDLNGSAGVAGAAAGTVVKLVFWSVLYVSGALLAAAFGGINFGPVGLAILKIMAVSLLPSAVADLITRLLGGDMAVAMIGNVVAVIGYWAAVAFMFRLDGGQTRTVVAAIAGVKLVTFLFLGGILAGLVGSVGPARPHGGAIRRGHPPAGAVVSVDGADEDLDGER